MQTFTIGSIDSKTAERIEATLTLKGMLDGGYYWFDARAAKDAALTVSNAQWQVPTDPTDAPSTPDVCPSPLPHLTALHIALDQLRTIANEPELREQLDTVYCTDQGTNLVRDQAGYSEVLSQLAASSPSCAKQI